MLWLPIQCELGARADGTYGFLRSQQEGDGGPGRAALRLGVWPEDLQECLAGRVGRVDRPSKDALERVSAATVDATGAAIPGRADGRILLRHGLCPAQRVRAALALSWLAALMCKRGRVAAWRGSNARRFYWGQPQS